MPDNRYNELDGQFIDQAWKEMRAQLDREMPLRTDRRRWLWLFLVLLLGAAGILGGWWYQQRSTPRPPVLEQRPVATAETPAGEETVSTSELAADNQISQSGITPLTEPARHSQPSGSLSAALDGVLQNGAGRATPPTRGEDDPSPTDPLQTLNNLPPVAAAGDPQEPDDFGKILAEPTPQADTAPQSRMGPLATLATRPVAGLAPGDLTGAVQTLDPGPQRRFRIGLEGTWLIESGDLASGWSAGITGHYEPAKGRLGALAGLHWQHTGTRPPFFEQENISLDQSEFVSTDFPDTTFFVNAQNVQGRYFAELESTTYLTLPLQASFKVNQQFRLEGGVQLAYLVAHRQTANYEFGLESTTTGTVTDSPRQSVILADDSFVDQPVNRIDVALSGGIGFYPGNRWGVRAHYNHGLIRPLESASGPNYNRQVRVSLSYFLNR